MDRTTQAGLHSQTEHCPTKEAGLLFQAADWPQCLWILSVAARMRICMSPKPIVSRVSGEVLAAAAAAAVFAVNIWLAILGIKRWTRGALGLSQDVSYIIKCCTL